MSTDGAQLSVQSLTKRFGETTVVDAVSFEVRKGEVIAIVGPSGSGKTTVLRCINGLERPTSGDVFFEGRHVDYTSKGLTAVRSQIGMIFQNFNLFPHRTVVGNVMEGLVVVRRLGATEAHDRAMAMLARVGLETKASAYPGHLSGGQKQRVAIARTLAMSPKVVLFDEVTSALDPELIGEVLQVMRDLADQGQTMLVVTHEMGFARDVADRVLFMDHGKVVEEGAAKDVLAYPKHARTRLFLRSVIDSLPFEPDAGPDAN